MSLTKFFAITIYALLVLIVEISKYLLEGIFLILKTLKRIYNFLGVFGREFQVLLTVCFFVIVCYSFIQFLGW